MSLPRLRSFLPVACLVAGCLTAGAQRSFKITLTTTNQNNPVIRWKAQSATPIGSLTIVPQYQVLRSLDLQTWTPVSPLLTIPLGQTNSFVDTNAVQAFYRVASIIDRSYATMTQVKLDFGQLMSADFFGAELFGASFKSANLNAASFAAADLRTAVFSSANLSNADFFAVGAFEAQFDEADLAGVDGSFGDFGSANFFDDDFTGADFRSAVLAGATLDFVNWRGVLLDADTVLDDKPRLVWQIINQGAAGATLTNLDLTLTLLVGADLNGARLNGSFLIGSDLRGADIRGADCTGADVRFVDWRGTLFSATTMVDATTRLVLEIENLNGAGRDLRNTNLSQTSLIDANLSSANLSNVDFTMSTLFNADFTGADLRRANFSSADLSGATLLNALTNNANFNGTTFNQTVMPDGSIRNF